MTFIKDLDWGEKMEMKVATYLAKDGDRVEFSSGKVSEWDYDINGIKYEQKSDRWTQRTGNICVELRGRQNQKTGILVTKADYWVTYPVGLKQIAVVPMKEMKRICRKHYPENIRKCDGNKCLLIPYSEIPSKYKLPYTEEGDSNTH